MAPALPPVRFSRLKRFALSAAHYADPSFKETGEMRKGTGLHCYMLGGESKVAIFRDGIRNAKSAKWIAFQEANQGKHILIPSELAKVEGMRRSLEKHQRAMALLDDGVQEQRITWDIGGRACAGTPDVVKPKNGKKRLVELKTCKSSAPQKFMWQGLNMFYPSQVSWYQDGLEKTMAYEPGPVDEVYVVAVESVEPYPVTVFRMRDSILARGRRQWRVWFEALRNCEQSNHFPAYTESDVDWEDEAEEGDGLDWGDEDDVAAQ